ncbi:hypothetical protein PR048_012920, partial [Dryococelus australis]
MDSEEEVVVVVSSLLAEEEDRIRKRNGTKRTKYGEYHTLYPDLVEDEMTFFQYFRMTEAKITALLDILREELEKQTTKFREPVGNKERLTVCLRTDALLTCDCTFPNGCFQRTCWDDVEHEAFVSDDIGECVKWWKVESSSSSTGLTTDTTDIINTTRDIVYSMCSAILEKLQPIVMPTPDEQLWASSEEMFRTKWNFPNVVAALDGKHVLIQAPPHSGSDFFVIKNTSADNSAIGKRLSEGTFHLPPPKPLPSKITNIPYVIIGDEDFPLCTYLMRHYSRDDVQEDEEKKIFNYRLSRARNTVKNTFGILAHDTCCWIESDCQMSLSDIQRLQSFRGISGNYCHDALKVRDYFKQYFNSDRGLVNWQRAKVRAGIHGH